MKRFESDWRKNIFNADEGYYEVRQRQTREESPIMKLYAYFGCKN